MSEMAVDFTVSSLREAAQTFLGYARKLPPATGL
jgi:hypothetical protein